MGKIHSAVKSAEIN